MARLYFFMDPPPLSSIEPMDLTFHCAYFGMGLSQSSCNFLVLWNPSSSWVPGHGGFWVFFSTLFTVTDRDVFCRTIQICVDSQVYLLQSGWQYSYRKTLASGKGSDKVPTNYHAHLVNEGMIQPPPVLEHSWIIFNGCFSFISFSIIFVQTLGRVFTPLMLDLKSTWSKSSCKAS